MLKILFVDDNERVLEAIRMSTRDVSDEWDVRFAEKSDDAMRLLDEETFDVVIADMRMPKVDEEELLMHVRTSSPSSVRIAISEHEEDEAVFRSTRIAHQFLGKQYDVKILRRTIEEIHEAQRAVPSAAIRQLVGTVDQLPALGEVYDRLMTAIDSGRANNIQLAEIISEDVALTAEILRLLNSSFFGLSRRVESVSQAIGLLGIDVLRAIVASHAVFKQRPGSAVDIDAISRRGQNVAAVARRVHALRNEATSNELANVYLAGMLHEVGALVLLSMDGTERLDLEGAFRSNEPTVDRLVFGADRYAVSSYLLGLWAFHSDIIHAVGTLGRPPDQSVGPMAWSLAIARNIVINGRLSDETADDAHLEAIARMAETGLTRGSVRAGSPV